MTSGTAVAELARRGHQYTDQLNKYVLSEIAIEVPAVLDYHDLQEAGISTDDLLHQVDFTLTHQIAKAVKERGAVGLIAPSATLLGDNLIIFPENMGRDSHLEVIESRNMRLYIPRA